MRRPRPALLGVALATALGLFARLWALGARPAHTAEARLAVGVLDVMEAGSYAYTASFEGPLLFHLQRLLFGLFGPSDFTMRLGVALCTALLPASAWLFRKRLREEAVVALAGLLAVTPVVLYYSRFLANDVLLVTFAVLTLGLVVRAADTGRHGYLYAAAASAALAAATTWYVVLYAGTWLVAGALLLDYRLFGAARAGRGFRTAVGHLLDRGRAAARRWAPPLGLAVAVFVVVTVLMYAPRPALWNVAGDPGSVFEVVGDATAGAWGELHGHWIQGRPTTSSDFLPYFESLVAALSAGAAVPVAFGAVGFVLDRYAPGGGRDVVAFATYWGAAGLLVYPAVAPEPAPWNALHVAVPFAVPAAVGLGAVYRFGRERLAEERRELATVAAVVLLLAGGQLAVAAYGAAYGSPTDGGLVYAGQTEDGDADLAVGQPVDDLDAALAPVYDVASTNDGVDVAVYGRTLDGTGARPLDWYFRANDVNYTQYPGTWLLPDDLPPVVVAATETAGSTESDLADIAGRLEGYDRVATLETRQPAEGHRQTVAVLVRADR